MTSARLRETICENCHRRRSFAPLTDAKVFRTRWITTLNGVILFRFIGQANLKDVSDQVNSVVTNAEQESILARLLRKVSLHNGLCRIPTLFGCCKC